MALKTAYDAAQSPHKSGLKNEVDGNVYTPPVLAKLNGSPKKVASGNVNDAPLTLKTDSSSGGLK